MPVIIAVVVIIVVIVGIAWAQDRLAERRGEKVRATAEELGLLPLEATASELLANTPGFLLFTQGTDAEVARPGKGEFTRATGPVTVTIFEYIFSIPMGRYTRSWRQTVLRFTSSSLDLPDFSITPESVFEQMVKHIRDKIMREELEGTAGVSFKGHPVLNERMHVRGTDRTQVQALFDETLLHYFEGGDGIAPHYDLCVEGSVKTLLVYHYDREVAPEELAAFLEAGLETYDRFVAAGRRA